MSTPQDPYGTRPPSEPTGSGGPSSGGSWSGASWSGGYGPPPQAWGAGGPAPYLGPPQTESKAIIALVLAVAAWVLCPIVPAIVALVLARDAQRDIDASGGRLTGDGLVTASKVIAWANLAVGVLFVVGGLLALLLFAGAAGS